jgi:hypothetical protein
VKTSTVASSPNAVTTAVASCTMSATSVHRGAARQSQRISSAAVRGAPRATAQIPDRVASSWLCAQYGVSRSSTPISGSASDVVPTW